MTTLRKTLTLFIFLLLAGQSFATHIVGGGITYECLGPSGNNARLYRFTLKVYRDCLNGQAPFDDPAHIAIYKGSFTSNFQYDLIDVDILAVQPVAINEPGCIDNLPLLCLEEATYVWETVLPNDADDSYFVEYQRCCRTNAIANIFDPGDTGATYFVEITPRAQQLCNSSPVFNNFPPVVICNNYPLQVDYSVSDSDGDQLVYRFCAPYGGGGSFGTGCTSPMPNPPCPPPYDEVIFIGPDYSPGQPMGGNPIININSQTGLITGTPTMNGQYVVGVCVEEYRNGELLSVTRRDFQFNVAPCAPQVTALVAHDEITAPQHYLIKRCTGTKTVFIDNQSFIQANINNFEWFFDLNNGNVLTNNSNFDLTVNFPDFGIYHGTLILNKGLDCGDTAFIEVRVFPPATLNLGPDYKICQDTVIQLNAGANFASYTWQDGSTQPTFTATGLGTYFVAAVDQCGNVLRDTVVISGGTAPNIALDDLSICPGKSATVTVPGFAQYSWGPSAGLSCTDCATVTVQPTVNTTYTVLATTSAGCTSTAGFDVTVLPTPMRTYVIQIYPNESVTIGGQTYNQATTVTLPVPSTTGGCDSLNTYIIEVLPTTLNIDCPPNVTVALPNNATSVAVDYANPTVSTDCPGDVPAAQLLSGPASGSNFPGGVNTVCYGASNTCNNSDSCCFTVTVTSLDIVCPPNITVALPNNATTVPVNYDQPTATTDCPGDTPVVTLQQGLASGANFPGGVNTVCYGATTTCGNQDECCFTVTVTTLDIVCPPNITVALPNNATTIPVNYAQPTATTDCPGDTPVVTLQQGLASGACFPGGVNTVCYGATTTCGNQDACCFTVTVTSLDIVCPPNITVALPNNATTIPVNYAQPTATTDCPGSTPVVTLQQGLASGSGFPSGVNTVCYGATNSCGNQDACCFTVTVTTLDIVCPPNVTVALPNNATTVPVTYNNPTTSTNCPGSTPVLQLLQGQSSGGNFPSGVNTVCYQATNTCGNINSCCFTITVTKLDIQCPANIIVQMPVAATSAVVDYNSPTTTTNCPDPTTTINLVAGLSSGSAFPLGVTKVCYEGTNTCGNRDTCCFNVTVTDPPPPCDIKVIGCMKFELLDIRLDSINQRRFRIRATNFCASELDYVLSEIPPGVVAVTPQHGTIYTAPNTGNQYIVRNPSASIFYAVRYRSLGVGLKNGQADIFEHRLPQQSHHNNYIHMLGKLKNGEYFEAYLNTFYCPVQPWQGVKPGSENREDEWEGRILTEEEFKLALRPNPTSGLVYVDVLDWVGQQAQVQVLNAQGQVVMTLQEDIQGDWLELEMDSRLANGLYYLVVQPENGPKATASFILER